MKHLIRAIFVVTLIAGLVAVAPAARAGTDPTACTVDGAVSFSPPVTSDGRGSGGTLQFQSTTLTCVGSLGGSHPFDAAGTRLIETCLHAEGSGTSSRGSFTFVRTGQLLTLSGIWDFAGVMRPFSVVVVLVPPAGQICEITGVTSADLVGGGTIG
jgi:hypothetical protein